MQDSAPHAEVAERFRYFLETTDLSREQFAAAVDGAVTARSLYAILSGRRRPSRALAVLIERQWGFRADYLLDGEGEMLVVPVQQGRMQSEDERAVLAFMAESVDNARTVRRDLDDAALWARLWARTNRMLDDLESMSGSAYPGAARRAFNECIDVAEAFADLKAKRYQRRVHHLTTAFVSRFLAGLNAELLLAARADQEAALDVEEHRLRSALEARAESSPPDLGVDVAEWCDAVAMLRAAADGEKSAAAVELLVDRALAVELDQLLGEIAARSS